MLDVCVWVCACACTRLDVPLSFRLRGVHPVQRYVMSPWRRLTSAHLTQDAAWPAALPHTSSWKDTFTQTHTPHKHADICINTGQMNRWTVGQIHHLHTYTQKKEELFFFNPQIQMAMLVVDTLDTVRQTGGHFGKGMWLTRLFVLNLILKRKKTVLQEDATVF